MTELNPTVVTEAAQALTSLETLQVSRESIRQLTADAIKAKDEDIKAARTALMSSVKACGDHISACNLCELFAQGTSGADTALRKAESRRRQNLKKALESAFSDYDFEGKKSEGKYRFVASLKDETGREADALLASLARLDELGVFDMQAFPENRETLKAAIAAFTPAPKVEATNPAPITAAGGITAADLAGFAGKVSSLQQAIAGEVAK